MSAPHRKWLRPTLVGVSVATALLVIGVVGYLTTDHPATGDPAPADRVELVAVAGGRAATSPRHGPFVTDGPRAQGFSHDALGAAIAASNIAPRITAAAGPDVYGPTLDEQCWGDIRSASVRLALAVPQLTPGRDELTVRGLYYRVIAGDPSGESVVISMLADTAQAQAAGGPARVDMTLRWADGDWRLRVPIPEPSIQHDVSGYTLLGPTS